jgi:tetratricopeptide (TPR) repeat protein
MEATYKQALCLREMERVDEAAALLEQLLAEADGDVYVVAASQLWLIRLQQRRFEDAEAIYGNLSLQYRFEDLARLIPSSDRRAIIEGSYRMAFGYNLLTFNETHLHYLTRADLTDRLLHGDRVRRRHIMHLHNLIRGHHILGDIEEATRIAQDAIRQYQNAGGLTPTEAMYVQEYLWLLRQQGRTNEALETLNQITEGPLKDKRQLGRLIVSRARIHAATGDQQEAARVLDGLLTDERQWDGYRSYAAGWLMRGFLHQEDGDSASARDAWRNARFRNWIEWNRTQGRKVGRPSGMEFEYAIISGALSQTFPKPELAELLSFYDVKFNGVPVGPVILSQSHVITPAVQDVGKDAAAIDHLRSVVFQDVGLKEFIRIPLRLLLIQVSARAVPSRDWTEDERQVLWQLGTDALDECKYGRVRPSQILQLAATWKGVNNLFGWQGVAPSLAPTVRQPIAYVFGFQYEQLRRLPEAVAFFETARSHEQGDSPLATLAQQQLDRIAAEQEKAESAQPGE